MQSSFSLNDNINAVLVYLREIYHTDLRILYVTDSNELIFDTFRQFADFLMKVAPMSAWCKSFLEYVRELMVWLNRPTWHVDWVVRSTDFTYFVRLLEADY